MIASVVIPTYRRNNLLAQAVRSCFGQRNVSSKDYEIVVVDNCPNKTAEGIVKDFISAQPAVRYVSEPRQGVVFARNTGISIARGDYIVFLDDDECATPNWLAELLKLSLLQDAVAVFGPIRETVDDELKHIHRSLDFPIVGRNFSRADGDDISDCLFYLGTGNSLFNKTRCFRSGNTPFDQRFNFCGGEDIDFLSRLRDQKVRFVWAAHAWVEEHVPAERLTMQYLMKRRFHSGQIRTIIEAKKSGRLAPLQIGFWMTVGGMQLLYYSIGFLFALIRRRDTLNYAARISGGAGKMLFFWYQNATTANG